MIHELRSIDPHTVKKHINVRRVGAHNIYVHASVFPLKVIQNEAK